MDDDLIKRLHARCVYGDARLLMWSKHDPLSAEAAAEIYRLRAENERLTKERDEARIWHSKAKEVVERLSDVTIRAEKAEKLLRELGIWP